MPRQRVIRLFACLCGVIASSSASAGDFGSDLGPVLGSFFLWPLAVGVCTFLARPGQRALWALIAALGYPNVWLVSFGITNRYMADYYQSTTTAVQLCLLSVIFVGIGLIVARIKNKNAPYAPELRGRTEVDAVCVILLFPTLPGIVNRHTTFVELLGVNASQQGHLYAPMIWFALAFIASFGLWRQQAWAWWLAVAICLQRIVAFAMLGVGMPQLLGGAHSHNGSPLLLSHLYLFALLMAIGLAALALLLLWRVATSELGSLFFAEHSAPRRWMRSARA